MSDQIAYLALSVALAALGLCSRLLRRVGTVERSIRPLRGEEDDDDDDKTPPRRILRR